MSASYVRDQCKAVAATLVTPFIDTENSERDPDTSFLSLEFNLEYMNNDNVNKCTSIEEGVVDLVFLFETGEGDGKIKQAEQDAKTFYLAFKDAKDKLVFKGIQSLETFNETRWYRVVIGIEYTYTS